MIRNLMSDEEWGILEPVLWSIRRRSGKAPKDYRLVLDGVFWIGRTGSPWRDLPDYFGPWDRVYQQFRRWSAAGLWELLLDSLVESSPDEGSVQLLDSSIIRAHQHAAGAKGGVIVRILDAQRVAIRRKSISAHR